MFTRAHKLNAGHAGGLRRQRGAALLLLLTMLILGAASVGMTAFGGSATLSRERSAHLALGQAREALIGYAVLHGRLPRPSPSAATGVEATTACYSEQNCTGFLPWATLGLGPMYARGKPLRYSVTPAFSHSQARVASAVATKTIVGRSGDRRFYIQSGPECSAARQCVPAVVIASGTYQGLATVGDQADNDHAYQHFIQRAKNDIESAPGGPFDDMLIVVPYEILIRRMSLTGMLEIR